MPWKKLSCRSRVRRSRLAELTVEAPSGAKGFSPQMQEIQATKKSEGRHGAEGLVKGAPHERPGERDG